MSSDNAHRLVVRGTEILPADPRQRYRDFHHLVKPVDIDAIEATLTSRDSRNTD